MNIIIMNTMNNNERKSTFTVTEILANRKRLR